MGELGERWLEGASGAIASPYIAPETLVAALPTASHRFVFVGQHGTRYLGETPLGPFSAMQASRQWFESYKVVAGRWFGLNTRGELWHGAFDDPIGVRSALLSRTFDFAIAPGGKGVAVTLPESLWWTEDAGEHWQPLEATPVGITSVTSDESGRLRVTALLPQNTKPVQDYLLSDQRQARGAEANLHAAPALMADIRALDEGRAVFAGRDWFALSTRDNGWYLSRGHFDEPLRTTRAEELDACHSVKLAARGAALVAFCQAGDSHSRGDRLEVLTADTENARFKLVSTVQGNLQQLHLAPLDASRILATGVCATQGEPPPTSVTNHQLVNTKRVTKCATQLPVIITLAAKLSVDAVQAPRARFAAPPLAASEDGQLAAFVARSEGATAWQLYLSTDSGRNFVAHEIDRLPVTGAAGSPEVHAPARRPESRVVQSLNFGEDRSLTLVLRDNDTPFVYNFDDRGQVVAASMAPPEVSRVDAVGPRILAVSLTQRNVYQSLDRGASFELIGHLPAPACLTYLACPVVCRTAGCLIGERFTRVSWGAEGAGPLDIAGNPEQRPFENEPPTERVSFRTPLVCNADVKSPFVTRAARAPMPEQVSIGDMLWYAPWYEPSMASAGMFWVRRGYDAVANTRALAPLEFRETIGPNALPADAGLAVDFDDAGLVFLRSKKVAKVGEPLGELDLASFLFKRPNWVHARFRDAQAISNQDYYLMAAGNARRLLPPLLSVTREGVFVEAHADARAVQFVTPAASTTIERVPWPVARVRDVHWGKVGDKWQVYALDETGSVLLRAEKPTVEGNGSGWSFVARTIANPRVIHSTEKSAQLRWGEKQPSLLLAQSERGHRLEAISAQRLTTDNMLLSQSFDVTLPAALSEPPPTCSAQDRRELTRVVLPLLPQAARAVQVIEGAQSARWLVATQAIAYASAKRTCIDAFWAETLPGSPPVNAVIGLENPTHSTVFRTEGGSLRAMPAQCHFDAHATPPPEYETRLQARWNLDHLPLESR